MTNAELIALLPKKAEIAADIKESWAAIVSMREQLAKLEEYHKELSHKSTWLKAITRVVDGVALNEKEYKREDYYFYRLQAVAHGDNNRIARIYLDKSGVSYALQTTEGSWPTLEDRGCGRGWDLEEAKQAAYDYVLEGLVPEIRDTSV